MKLAGTLAILVISSSTLPAQIPAGMKVGMVRYLQAGYAGTKGSLIAAAQAMPAADYSFKPSQMNEARTFAAVITHAADGMVSACAAAKGVANPGGNSERTARTKPEATKALADAFAFCDDFVSSLTEQSAAEFVTQGQGEIVRGAILMGVLAHNAEMWGISTVYLRAKNIVPPGSK